VTQLHDLTALEQGAAVRSREISPLDLVEHYLERIDRLDATVGAFVTVTAELARAQAGEAQRRAADDNSVGPLHGVPVPVKDLAATAGVRTTFGSAAFADFVPDYDDTVVTLLRRAGTVMLGKSNAPEFGAPCYTEPAVAPPARTPWDLARSAGGSSGGAAAAVAAGLAPVAHASDGGGSIRIPASVCGLVGLKPTRGRISGGPVKGDVSGLGTDGALGRTVADCAALLDVMAVRVPGDPYNAAPLPPGDTFLAAVRRDPGRPMRIARFAQPVVADSAVHPECLRAFEEASHLLEELGHAVEDVPRPLPPEAVPVFEVVWSVLTTLTPVAPGDESMLQPLTRWLRGRGAGVSATQFAQALVAMQQHARRALVALAPYDAVLTPTLAQPPALVGALRNDGDPAADFAAQKAFTPFTAVWNVTGMPAVSLPLHWTAEGLPVGVMLAARPGEDASLLGLASQIEAARPWRDRQPPLW
jgi:amidase